MKFIITTFFALVLSFQVNSQVTTVIGNLTDSSNMPVVNHSINYGLYLGGTSQTGTAFTDSSGSFYLSATVNTSTPGALVLFYMNCFGIQHMDSLVVIPNQTPNQTQVFNLNYCTGVIQPPSCNAFFTYSISGNVVSFAPNVSGVAPISYNWSFNNGQVTSSLASPSYTHSISPVGGSFDACLTINTADGCSDTYCTNINITPVTPPCNAQFTITTLAGNHYFEPSYLDTSGATQYLWTVNGNTFSNHYFASLPQSSGSSVICLSVSGPVCTQVWCDSVVNINPVPCNANFTYINLGDTFILSADFNSPTASYVWQINNTTYTGSTITFVNANTNANTMIPACLTVTDGTCSSSVCDTLQPTIVSINNNIYGYVQGANNSMTGAVVYLIELDSSALGLMLSAIDSAYTDTNGSFTFQNVNIMGLYLVKAMLPSFHPDFNNFLPSYFTSMTNINLPGGATVWNNAMPVYYTALTPINSGFQFVNINLTAGQNNGGPGFIAGLVSQGAGRGMSTGLKNVQVMVLNENKMPLNFTYSNEDGYFEIGNLPLGNYFLTVDISGLPVDPMPFSITENSNGVEDVAINVESTGVQISITSSVNQVKQDVSFALYPNPASQFVNIEWNKQETSNTTYSIYDMKGKLINSGSINSNFSVIALDDFTSGIYMLRIADLAKTFKLQIIK